MAAAVFDLHDIGVADRFVDEMGADHEVADVTNSFRCLPLVTGHVIEQRQTVGEEELAGLCFGDCVAQGVAIVFVDCRRPEVLNGDGDDIR